MEIFCDILHVDISVLYYDVFVDNIKISRSFILRPNQEELYYFVLNENINRSEFKIYEFAEMLFA